MKMKNVLLVAIGLLLLLAVVGCGASNGGNNRNISESETYPVYTVKLDDGRKLDCIFISTPPSQSAVGGPSCDWENAK